MVIHDIFSRRISLIPVVVVNVVVRVRVSDVKDILVKLVMFDSCMIQGRSLLLHRRRRLRLHIDGNESSVKRLSAQEISSSSLSLVSCNNFLLI